MSYAVAIDPTPLRRFLSPEPYMSGTLGVDLLGVADRAWRSREHYYDPVTITRQQEALEATFQALIEQWLQDTQFYSSLSDMAAHPAYQAIIGLGKPVVPFLLRELEMRPVHLFTALRVITGADPVKPSERGRIDKMAKAWLRWGKEQGLIW